MQRTADISCSRLLKMTMRITFDSKRSRKLIFVGLLAIGAWRPSLAAEKAPAHQAPSSPTSSHVSSAEMPNGQPTGFTFPESQQKTNAEKSAELATNQEIAHDTLAGAISTGILAFVTFFLALFTYRLWKDTGELVKESSKSSERQLRAYIGITATGVNMERDVERTDIYGQPEVIRHYVANVDTLIKNHGRTPANEIDVSTSWSIVATADSGNPHESSFESANHQGGTLMPEASLQAPLRSSIKIQPDEFSDIFETKTKSLQVTGTISYKDSFEKERTTTFNWLVIKHGFAFTTTLCAKGNKAT